MPQIQITLTPAESKRLIAKAVAALPEVKRAFRSGIIVIGVGTTNARVAEELLKRKMDRNRFVAGVVLPKGTCIVPLEKRLREIVIRKGNVIDARLGDVLEGLTSKDIFIKGANAIDASGTAGIMIGSKDGGTIAKMRGAVVKKGVKLVIPVGLEKFVPGSIKDFCKSTGISKPDYATGCSVGVMPVSGKVVTELEAVNILTSASAVVISKGGVSGAEGSVTLLVKGSPAQLRKARNLVDSVKGEPGEKIKAECKICKAPRCWYRKAER